MEEKIVRILDWADLFGFTELLQWDFIRRYVVAFTDNVERTTELLAKQAEAYAKQYDNLTIWWRFDHKQEKVLVDIGTSTASLKEAYRLKLRYNQRAIRELLKRERLPNLFGGESLSSFSLLYRNYSPHMAFKFSYHLLRIYYHIRQRK